VRASKRRSPHADALDPRERCATQEGMASVVVPFSIALLLTSLFAFRFRYWDRPRVLAVYFLGFFALEEIAQSWLLPPGAIPIEVAYICLPLAAVFIGMTFVARRLEASENER
jgi:hypothetical protein